MHDTSCLSSLACVIVHFGDAEQTMDCLHSLFAGTHAPRIIVSCNNAFAELSNACSTLCNAENTLILLDMKGNKGFAAACNAGLRAALQMPGISAAWLLNNDATVAPDAAANLASCLAANPRAIVGTSVFRADKPEHLELALGCRFDPLTTICAPLFADTPPSAVPDTVDADYVYGASMAFPLRLIEEIGFLDERFFLYYEEHDFCRRAAHAGWRFHWCRGAKVRHSGGGATCPRKKPKGTRAFSHYHENLSTWRFLQKHHPLLLPPAICLRSLAKSVLLPLRGDAALLPSYWRALFDFLGGRGTAGATGNADGAK